VIAMMWCGFDMISHSRSLNLSLYFHFFFFFGGEVVSTFDPFYHPVSNTMGIIGWRQELGLPYNDFNIKNNQKDKRDWNKVS